MQAGLIISSYVIYFISDGQTEGGLTSIQPEARSVVSSFFTFKLSIYIINFSVEFFPLAIAAIPKPHTHRHLLLVVCWSSGLGFDSRVDSRLWRDSFQTLTGSYWKQLFIITSHRPDMTEILLKGRKIASHLIIHHYLFPLPLPTPRASYNLGDSRARAFCACSRCGWGLFGHFYSYLSFLSSVSLSLGEDPIYM